MIADRTPRLHCSCVEHPFRALTWVAHDPVSGVGTGSLLIGATSTDGMRRIEEVSRVICTAVVAVDVGSGLASVTVVPAVCFTGIRVMRDVLTTVRRNREIMCYISQRPLPSGRDIEPEWFAARHPMVWQMCSVDVYGEDE